MMKRSAMFLFFVCLVQASVWQAAAQTRNSITHDDSLSGEPI